MSSSPYARVQTHDIADDAVTLDEINSSAFASQAEAEAGTENTKVITSLRVKQAIDALSPVNAVAAEGNKGVVELATLAEQGAHTETGSEGPLVLQSKNTVKDAVIYTPAYLTGGNSAESDYTVWDNLAEADFAITIDGVAYDINAINLSAVTSMNDVAAAIQAAIRAETGGTETVVWSTNHFVITSGDTTSSSAITVTSASGTGTGEDISGAGATTWMDCDVGNGVVTNTVLNQAADENKVPVLDATGKLDKVFMPTLLEDLINSGTTVAEIDQALDGISANVTAANLGTLTGGAASDADTLHTHPNLILRKSGLSTFTFLQNATTSSVVIAHGLGVAPNWVELAVASSHNSNDPTFASMSIGTYDADGQHCSILVVDPVDEPQSFSNATHAASAIVGYNATSNTYKDHLYTVTIDATNITLTEAAGDAADQNITVSVEWRAGL